ncbi:MAG: hypothetical protein IJ447_01065 [Clostridia bacterium]|nr:hypothetical protein [Clostridia bacterium]
MIDIEMELSSLFLALRLTKQAEESRKRGEDDFILFRKFACLIREYENKRGERVINE